MWVSLPMLFSHSFASRLYGNTSNRTWYFCGLEIVLCHRMGSDQIEDWFEVHQRSDSLPSTFCNGSSGNQAPISPSQFQAFLLWVSLHTLYAHSFANRSFLFVSRSWQASKALLVDGARESFRKQESAQIIWQAGHYYSITKNQTQYIRYLNIVLYHRMGSCQTEDAPKCTVTQLTTIGCHTPPFYNLPQSNQAPIPWELHSKSRVAL